MRSFSAILLCLFPCALTAMAQDATTTLGSETVDNYPLIVLAVGIVSVLGLIIGLRMNAFLALIISAIIVSMMVVGEDGFQMEAAGGRMSAVVKAFGDSAGGIGIVIAMAAIIGKCMLDSGAADRVVRTAIKITGVKNASIGLMASGFILAVPVFFDTVFYLLVPLARSLFKQTSRNYLRYLMAIATGGAITHTLVPPTPGPLLVSANLGVDIGTMMWVGTLVAIPAAIVGLIFSVLVDRIMPVPMRPLGPGAEKHETLADSQLPSLWLSLLPIVLPVALIGMGTLTTTLADKEDRGRLQSSDLLDPQTLRTSLREGAQSQEPSPAKQLLSSASLSAQDRELLTASGAVSEAERERMTEVLNRVLASKDFYDQRAFLGVPVSQVARKLLAQDQVRLKPVLRRRMNRALLEDAFAGTIKPHQWETPRRVWANRWALWSDANFALLLAALCAIATLKYVRKLSLTQLGGEIEEALMSGGMIILITAAGGAFGGMLNDADVGGTIEKMFEGSSGGGLTLLLLSFVIAAVLKVAQGSSTVSMIVSSGMIAGIVSGQVLGFHPVYLATAVGSGSLMGSWMNDSGFWVFAKMGGLTEGEALRSWTLLLVVLSLTGLLTTVVMSQLLPMNS